MENQIYNIKIYNTEITKILNGYTVEFHEIDVLKLMYIFSEWYITSDTLENKLNKWI